MRSVLPAPVFIVTALAIAGCAGDSPTGPTAPIAFQLSLTPSSVPAGASSEGLVMMNGTVQSDVFILLSSSDGVASVPAYVALPAGATRATFRVTTRLVAADTVVKIIATAGGDRQEASLQVVSPVAKPPTLDALMLDTAAVRGGQRAEGTVRLTGAAPAGGVSVGIRSSNSAASVPTSVAIQAGALSATFAISTRPVDIDTQFEITASYLDQTRIVPFRVTP